MKARPHTRGFTLLEVIVVLVIIGLLSGLLMQGLGQVLAARYRVADNIDRLNVRVLERNLVLQPLRGLFPDYEDGPFPFAGGRRELKGLSLMSLSQRIGVPVGFRMFFRYDVPTDMTRLMYEEDGEEEVVLAQWPGDDGSFSYRDHRGDWERDWPPRATGMQRPPLTPSLVRIETGLHFPSTLVAFVAGPHTRLPRMRDFSPPPAL